MKLIIEIRSSIIPDGAKDIAPCVDLDKGPLSIPEHIKVGAIGYGGHTIGGYGMQVDEYDIWLEDQLKAQNMEVMVALDDIFRKAQTSGVILLTQWVSRHTHAHVVERTIRKLAGEPCKQSTSSASEATNTTPQ